MKRYKDLDELKADLQEHEYDSIVFEAPDYLSAVIGISTHGNVVYSLSKMVEYIMDKDETDEEGALEYISYNTIELLSGSPNDPVIINDLWS